MGYLVVGSFDHICHEWLLANAPMDTGILAKWLKAGYIEKEMLNPTEAGTPQGGIISPVLANLTLDGLETKLRKKFPQAKVNLVRFADDFVRHEARYVHGARAPTANRRAVSPSP